MATAQQPNERYIDFNQLLQEYDPHIACDRCCIPESEITHSLIPHLQHDCAASHLLVKQRGVPGRWRLVSPMPSYPNPERYAKCRYYVEGKGCSWHLLRCSFARSVEEMEVWNILKQAGCGYSELVKWLKAKQGFPTQRSSHVNHNNLKERIHMQFPGQFMECCGICFRSTPRTCCVKSNRVCQLKPRHSWEPILVLRQYNKQSNEYEEVRPMPQKTVRSWVLCKRGKQCEYRNCWFAHSDLERVIWTAESQEGFDRSILLRLTQKQKQQQKAAASPSQTHQYYCQACTQTFVSKGYFMNHCNTLQHSETVREMNSKTTEWKFRSPPPTNQAYKLCERASSCLLGNGCIYAHSESELQEWHRRDRASRKNITAADEQGLLSYQDGLLREYRDSIDEALIMSEVVPGVTISCERELVVLDQMENVPLKWQFKIKAERPLVVVALLKQEPGASFSLDETSSEPCTYCSGEQFLTADMTYDITVSFKSIIPGLYEQWLVLDFDMRPVLLQKLKVRVGQPSSVSIDEPSLNHGPSPRSIERWHRGNRVIIPYLDRTEEQEELLKEYKPPQMSFQYKPTDDKTPLNHQNYKERMHSFLYNEEWAEDQIISRLNVRGAFTLSDILQDPGFGMKFAPQGELFCAIEVPKTLCPDTSEGWLLKRRVQSALVAPISSSAHNQSTVYEARVLQYTTSENLIHLQLPKICCSVLKLKPNETCDIEVQFRLDRLWFCEMHKAVDLLPDTERVIPDLKLSNVTARKKQYPNLNSKQQAAMDVIVEDEGGFNKAPFLIYGPFGTGKTLTLATAGKELTLQPKNRVLICTCTNSSADLYVTKYFHEHFLSGHLEAKPLRIKAEEASIKSTDEITLQYCHLSQDGKSFSLPDKDTLDHHRIVITTTAMARHLHHLKLPDGYFTHILIDEASQMLECEALMPLGLAGPNTRVVLTGDHMQMGPKLFSVEDDQRSNQNLLNRLFHYYQGQKSDAALKNRIIFNENYRSTKEIVDFVSTHFYVGKTDVIKAVGNVPAHPKDHPLKFQHIRGQSCLHACSMSWYNIEEVTAVVEVVEHILSDWPSTWGDEDQSSICVLSEGFQVLLVRQELRKRNLKQVTVENMANVQGKQFRAIVITAVQTCDNLLSYDSHCPEFFNDPCVLNTAMTRAQSQVVVIGDAIALCNFGKCSRIWKSYIDHCICKQTANPNTLNEHFLAQESIEISRFIKYHKEDNSDSESSTSEIPDDDDPILRELLDENNDVRVDVTSDGLLDIIHGEQSVHELDQCEVTESSQNNSTQRHSSNYRRCTLIMERFDSGYAIPHDEPSLRINIKGRMNIGHSFPGDLVDVEIVDTGCHSLNGRVVTVLSKEGYASKVFVCTIDSYDGQVMTPINICVSKIYTPFWKDKPNHIPVRKLENLQVERFVKINEESKRNCLFIVKVLKWREGFRYPLGVVVKVLPKVTSLKTGLDVLDIEYQFQRVPPVSLENDCKIIADMHVDVRNRKDYRGITTFTIDPAHSKDIDDAISVRDLGTCYEIGVHIADVAGLLNKDSKIDEYAQHNGTTFYPPAGEVPVYMFPESLSTHHFSLLPGYERNTISLMVEIEKKTDCIKQSHIHLSVIRSDRQLSYDEAENIIQNSRNKRFDTLEGCVAIACHFSEVHRKARKQDDWCYKIPDEHGIIGRRRSHKMVEEVMIMYNHAVTDLLLSNVDTVNCTPVRCQDRPTTERLCQFKENFTSLIPFSIHFTYLTGRIDSVDKKEGEDAVDDAVHSGHCLEVSRQMPSAETEKTHQGRAVKSPETFSILTSIMKCLESALTSQDIHRIVDLLTTVDIYPQLQPLVIALKKSTRKANILCSNSSHQSRIGHYDLQLDSYTWATSPIRRYVDVIVQRALHSTLKGRAVEYTPHEIEMCCLSFTQKSDQQSQYERKAQSLNLASKLKNQSARKVAFLVDASPNGRSLRVSFPLNRQSIPDEIPIMYRDMQIADQPEPDEHDNSVIFKWLRRVYSFTNEHIHADLQQGGPNPLVTTVSADMWKDALSAIKEENWDSMFHNLQMISSSSSDKQQCLLRDTVQTSKTNPDPGHYVELPMKMKPGDVVQVQLGAGTKRGLLVPEVQMLIISDKFEICLEHSKNPTDCFSRYALHSSKPTYPTYMEYQKIWKPLCKMESASNAVAENDSIIIEDVHLTWKQKEQQRYGTFQLPWEKKKLWAIECDLKHCFLCIRMRDPDQSFQTDSSPSKDMIDTGIMDIPSPIWVAHGITTKVNDEEEDKDVEIDFRINHVSMEIPSRAFLRDTKFTLELIPKLLPDVRKEDAISNLTRANQLVKDIALGKRTSSASLATRWTPARFDIRECSSITFPVLNNSQSKAIREALIKPFTLIQGPPGTGKTVVGVHLVYWFFIQNQKVTHIRPNSDDDPAKRRCILYCGPSNKSVDVVACYLLKLKDVLKPLRVYGDQMEMLEFPYPGSNLKLSRRSVREEKPNSDLRSITLHHLIRMPQNPFADEIQSFDARIQRNDELTDKDIERYKILLAKARHHELMRHDVILCTCTAASNHNFAKLDLQQIIIDECAMATEPEAFIPLVTHKPEQIVLLGDHKQLQPIVHCDLVARLGMRTSLFERYMEKAFMLDTQYRMQERICEFPSKEFYGGNLKTGTSLRTSAFLNQSSHPTPILFGHVEGKEISLVVSTERGNENSKANIEEAEQSVYIASLLITHARVEGKDIAILTPYNAQVAKISQILTKKDLKHVNVNTITKSQGSEWRYVILSMVRSCPKAEIDPRPPIAWLRKKLGFIMDPNQVNVGITRAQEGLCIIGNRELLWCSSLWQRLLIHYQNQGCMVDSAKNIQVQNPQAKTKSRAKAASRF